MTKCFTMNEIESFPHPDIFNISPIMFLFYSMKQSGRLTATNNNFIQMTTSCRLEVKFFNS